MASNVSSSLFNTTALPLIITTHSSDYVDITSLPLYHATLWIQKILLPAVVLFGVFGNVMTIFTVRQFQTRDSSIDLFFTALAITDFCVLVSSPFDKWLKEQFDFRILAVHNVVCKLIRWVSFSTPPLSAWLLVAFTAQRAVSVLWPHRVNVLCTRRRSCYIVIVIAIFFPALYSHVMYGYSLVKIDDGNTVACAVSSPDYVWFLEEIFVYYDVVMFTLLPFLCMMASNCVLVWTVTAALKMTRVKLTTGRSKKDEEREKKVSAITITAMAVSWAFVVLTLPYLINNFFFATEFHIVKGVQDYEEKVKRDFINEILYFLANANFALNFYLYCLTGSKFRNAFRRIITCGKLSSRTTEASHTSRISSISATSDGTERLAMAP